MNINRRNFLQQSASLAALAFLTNDLQAKGSLRGTLKQLVVNFIASEMCFRKTLKTT
jgi:hypothetical protein